MSAKKQQLVIPAVRGIQSGVQVFAFYLSIANIAKFVVDAKGDEDIETTFKRQRALTKSRAKKIADYIRMNRNFYIIPPITCDIDSDDVKFIPVSDDNSTERSIGKLIIPLEAPIFPLDGQHRVTGCKILVKEYDLSKVRKPDRLQKQNAKELRDFCENEKILVKALVYINNRRAQQYFSDINSNASKPTTSLVRTFDHRDFVSELSREIATDVFDGGFGKRSLIEFEKNSVRAKSPQLFAFAALTNCVKILHEAWREKRASKAARDRITKRITEFFKAARKEFAVWGDDFEARQKNLLCTALGLEAVCSYIATQPGGRELELLPYIAAIDFNRNNKAWEELGVIVEGRILKSQKSSAAIQRYIARELNEMLSKKK